VKEIKKIIEIHEWVDFGVYLEVREGEDHSLEKKKSGIQTNLFNWFISICFCSLPFTSSG